MCVFIINAVIGFLVEIEISAGLFLYPELKAVIISRLYRYGMIFQIFRKLGGQLLRFVEQITAVISS